MKIIFDYQIFSLQAYGGISRYFCELVRELKCSYNQDVNVISPFYLNTYLKEYSNIVPILGLRYKAIPKSAPIVRKANEFLTIPLMKLYEPDIVHETYYSSKRISPNTAKVVLTVYDMIHEKFADQFSAKDNTQFLKRQAVERADHVICISKQTQNDLIQILGINPDKTSVIHLGFSLTNTELLGDSIKTTRPFLLYVGNRNGYKNFEALLKSYANSIFLRSNFDLICFGGGGVTQNEKNLMNQHSISLQQVHFVSGGDSLLAKYYQSASAFIYPSLYEGFGIPPLEAMSFNCPVVCSNVSSIPEVVGDAAEMFDPYEPDSIRSAIERVVSDNSLKQTLIARGQERIKLFSWQRCAQKTLAVYQRLSS